MKVVILRGISGSGKSTWAKGQSGAVVVSADDYFLQADGNYRYVAEDIHEAHKTCYRAFMDALARRDPLIIVDNTNIFMWEFSVYILPAEVLDYEVEIITFLCDPELAIARKQWVPADKVRRNAALLDQESKRFPPFMQLHHTVVQVS